VLFDRVKVRRIDGQDDSPARNYADYQVDIDRDNLPAGVSINEIF